MKDPNQDFDDVIAGQAAYYGCSISAFTTHMSDLAEAQEMAEVYEWELDLPAPQPVMEYDHA